MLCYKHSRYPRANSALHNYYNKSQPRVECDLQYKGSYSSDIYIILILVKLVIFKSTYHPYRNILGDKLYKEQVMFMSYTGQGITTAVM